ncbi:MAG: hypothetical protein FLDDKLPJ_02679 [Phycisphaerae bacterium]|nr:hypothetical protein [Phycisphaerae bacterium]
MTDTSARFAGIPLSFHEGALVMHPQARTLDPLRWFSAVAAAVFLAGCGKPGVEFRGFDIQRAEFQSNTFEVDFDVRFRINNPFKFDLFVLPHQMRFTLKSLETNVNDLMFTLAAELPPGGRIPAEGFGDLRYSGAVALPVTTEQQRRAFCGGDIPYELAAVFDFNPTPWGPQDIELKYANEVRIPRAPEVELRAADFDLSDIQIVWRREVFAPLTFLDDFDLTKLAVDAFLGVVDQAVNLNLISDVDRTKVKCVFGRATSGCATVITGISGVTVDVPLRVRNPNRYPIRMPSLNWAVDSGNTAVVAFDSEPQSGTIAADGGTRNVTMKTALTFPSTLSLPAFDGEFRLDMGYGLWVFPLAPP